jgi:predicted glycosyltransferase
MTASAHPLVFRPLVELLQAQGHEVEITAREYAQTLQLIESHGMTATVIGHHGGRSAVGKFNQMRSRLKALRQWAKGRDFDVALAHGSHELTMTARRLGIPSATTFDYEWAWLQHQLGCRAATRVVVPDAIPPERLSKYTAVPPKLRQYPGLKEEYYLSDFEPDRSVLTDWSIDSERVLVVLRPPPDVSLYHRHSNPLFPQTLEHLGRAEDVHAFVIPRTDEQRDYVKSLELPSVIVPEQAVDAQSLIAFADLVVSAGGTMNREAAALGVPVYTTYGGRLGGVDEQLIRDGRLRPLTDPRALELEKRSTGPETRERRRASAAETLSCANTVSIICVSMRRTGFSVIIGSWKIIAMRLPRRSRSSGSGSLVRSRPLNRIEPPAMRPGASSSPMIENPVTDLPEPDSPTSPRIRPAVTVNETPSTARTVPAWVSKWVLRSRTSRVGALIVSASGSSRRANGRPPD